MPSAQFVRSWRPLVGKAATPGRPTARTMSRPSLPACTRAARYAGLVQDEVAVHAASATAERRCWRCGGRSCRSPAGRRRPSGTRPVGAADLEIEAAPRRVVRRARPARRRPRPPAPAGRTACGRAGRDGQHAIAQRLGVEPPHRITAVAGVVGVDGVLGRVAA